MTSTALAPPRAPADDSTTRDTGGQWWPPETGEQPEGNFQPRATPETAPNKPTWPTDTPAASETGPLLREPANLPVVSASLAVAHFLVKIYGLCRLNLESRAVDEVYNFMDDHLLARQFSVCDDVLGAADPRKMLPSLVISFLIVTRRAKPRLKVRSAFYARALAALVETEGASQAERLVGKYC